MGVGADANSSWGGAASHRLSVLATIVTSINGSEE